MDRQILNFTANEQVLTCDNPIRISTNKVNYIEAHFSLGENWSGYDSVRAVWWNDFKCISTVLDSQGVTFVPSEVMKRNGQVKVNLVGSISDGDVLTDRLTSYPVVAVVVDCVANVCGAETSPITPSQFEQYVAIVRSLVAGVRDIDHIELNNDYTLTVYYSDGTSDTTTSIRGADGNGIVSVTKTGTSGLVDTYTITFTDGNATTFTVTNGEKGDTGNGIQSIAKTGTSGLVDTYTITYTNGNASTFTVTNGDKGDKGDTGEVSLAELEGYTIVQTNTDNAPYLMRATPKCGSKEYDTLVGGSVAWNQLVPNGNFADDSAWTKNGWVISNNKATLTVEAAATGFYGLHQAINTVANHKYFIGVTVSDYSVASSNMNRIFFNPTVPNYPPSLMDINGNGRYQTIASATADSQYIGVRIQTVSNVAFQESISNFVCTDLTLAFGSAIADYVYTLEQSTAGSGIAWLKSYGFLSKDYFPFDAGSMLSVHTTAKKITGKNLFPIGEWFTAYSTSVNNLIIGDTSIFLRAGTYKLSFEYYMDGAPSWSSFWRTYSEEVTSCVSSKQMEYGALSLSTASSWTSKAVTVTLTKNGWFGIDNAQLRGGIHYRKIQLELGSTATAYEEFKSITYPLADTDLRGILKLDANNNLYYDGDIYPSDGNGNRRYVEVDLGTLNWTQRNAGLGVFSAKVNDAPPNVSNFSILCSKYPTSTDGVSGMPDKSISSYSSYSYKNIIIKDSAYANVSENAFATAMSGVKLVYELATPTTETLDPFTSPQTVYDGGTEEYVDSRTVPMPVGHNTDYPMTIVDTMPSANGNYTMKLTVSGGKKSVTWESV